MSKPKVYFDMSELNMNAQQQVTIMVALLFWSSGLRKAGLRDSEINGRTKIDELFKYGSITKLRNKLSDDNPSWDWTKAHKEAEKEIEKKREDAAVEVLKYSSVYFWIDLIFTDEPQRVINLIHSATGTYPDGLQINFTSKPNWL
jgi:hypothetical protein